MPRIAVPRDRGQLALQVIRNITLALAPGPAAAQYRGQSSRRIEIATLGRFVPIVIATPFVTATSAPDKSVAGARTGPKAGQLAHLRSAAHCC